MKLFPIEGNHMRLDGGAMFGNCPKTLWTKWFEPDTQNRIDLATRALLLQTDDGRNILFEAGIGNFYEQKIKERYGIQGDHQLLLNLKKLGLEHTDIDVIILSHLHFDHAGGMLSSEGELLFPKAQVYVGQKHWVRALTPHPREKASFLPHLNELLKNSQRLNLVEGEMHPQLDFGVNFSYSDGHTIGLMISIIKTPEGPLAYVSDLVPGSAWIHLPITMGYDRFPELLVDEKKDLYHKIIAENGKIFFTHDPNISSAKIVKQEDKFALGLTI